jgi:hypothetical protein
VASVLRCKCARCRIGNMFTHPIALATETNMAMPKTCTVCGQPFELEVGFYYGTGYVSYALTVALSVANFVAFWVLYGISINDNSLYIYLGLNILVLLACMPYLMRLSRAIWLSFFVRYQKNWATQKPDNPERIVEEQMGNW